MKGLGDLHRIIQSLNKSEKRSFRMFAGKASTKVVLLFDLLEKQPVYQPKEINRLLRSQNLHVALSTQIGRLRTKLLKSQRALYSDQNIDARLYNFLEEISFLHDKQLLEIALATVEKAIQLARRFSRVHHSLILIGWKRRILLELRPKDTEAIFKVLRLEEAQLLQDQELLLRLQDLQVQMTMLVRTVQSPQNQAEQAQYLAVGLSEEVAKGMESENFLTRTYARHIRGLFHFARQEHAPCYELYVRIMEDWRLDKSWIEDQPDLFLTTINLYQTAAMYSLNDLRPLDDFLRFVRRVPVHQPKLRFRLQRISYHKTLLLLMNRGRFEEGLALAAEIREWMEKHQSAIDNTLDLTLSYNLAIFYFFSGDPSAANQWVVRIVHLPGEDERKDIRRFSRLLQLILHDQLGNHELVESLHANAKRYLDKRDKISNFQRAILNTFSPKSYESIDRRPIVKALLSKLNSLPEENDALPFGYTEVQLWAESVIRGTPLTNIFLERIEK